MKFSRALPVATALIAVAIIASGCSGSTSSTAPVTSESQAVPASLCSPPYAEAKPYDATKSDYKACDVVVLDGKTFIAKNAVGVNGCPIEALCPKTVDVWSWTSLEAAEAAAGTKSEFAYYQDYKAADGSNGYAALVSQLNSDQRDCTAADYSVKPQSTDTLLDCYPQDPTQAPNVKNLMKIFPEARFKEFTPTLAAGDASLGYPVNPAYKSDSYIPFLRSIARYPAMCARADENCARALAAYFAQASQESGQHPGTGSGEQAEAVPLHSAFDSQRESLASGAQGYELIDVCPAGITCPPGLPAAGAKADPEVNYTGWYYGRGPFQVSYSSNYGLMAKMLYGEDKVQFLMDWPDLVAWDPDLQFMSGMWFFMTPQSGKPSMFDIITGVYSPDPSCVKASDCEGIMAAPGGGTLNPFETSIMIINPIECGPTSTQPGPEKRAALYLEALAEFGAKPVATEATPIGCPNIRAYTPAGYPFANKKLKYPYVEREAS